MSVDRFNIKLKVDMAVTVFDSFTGKQLTGSAVRISVPGKDNIKPVVKKDGYYVILAGNEPVTQVKAEAYGYSIAVMDIDKEKYGGKLPVLSIWLSPDRTYPVPKGTTLIEGQAEPGAKLAVVIKDKSRQMKLLSDYQAKDQIMSVFSSAADAVTGRQLAIGKGSENKFQIFCLQEETDEGENTGSKRTYRIEYPLGEDIKKTEGWIYPIQMVFADEKGNFFMPVNAQGDDTVKCIILSEGKKAAFSEHKLDLGKNNHIVLK